MNDCKKLIDELLYVLDIRSKMLHQKYLESDPHTRLSHIVNGQAIAMSEVIVLIKDKFNGQTK